MISLNHWCQLGRVQFCGISSQCDLDSLSEQFHWNWSYQVLVLQLVISKFWFPSGAIVLQWIYCNTHSLWLEHCTWISLEILCTNREPDSTDIVTKGRFRSVGLLKVDMILPWQFWFLLDQSLKVSKRNSVCILHRKWIRPPTAIKAWKGYRTLPEEKMSPGTEAQMGSTRPEKGRQDINCRRQIPQLCSDFTRNSPCFPLSFIRNNSQ